MQRKILVVLVDRANYGRIKPVMQAIKNDESLKLDVLCTGTMVLPRFGNVVDIVKKDGFEVTSRIYMEVEGSNPTTMSKSIGLGIIEFTSEFDRLRPDIVLIIGDRYEALAAAISAAYMNLTLAHIQGGEVSGSIDESCRHAITKFAHLHFPSTERSANFIKRMGENPSSIHNVGCPVGDYILRLPKHLDASDIQGGVGNPIDPNQPFLLVIFHPVTTHISIRCETEEMLNALNDINLPTIWLWPNVDAGSDRISSAIRAFREKNRCDWLYLVKNFEPDVYQRVLKNAAVAIGNSSSFMRDSSFTGTPVVLVGDRQIGREHGKNLIRSEINKSDIVKNVRFQLEKGRYDPEFLYGDGTSSEKIVNILKTFNTNSQKIISYVNDIQ